MESLWMEKAYISLTFSFLLRVYNLHQNIIEKFFNLETRTKHSVGAPVL